MTKPNKTDSARGDMFWEKFEEYFVADGVLDCIPKKNWEEMKQEVVNRINWKAYLKATKND